MKKKIYLMKKACGCNQNGTLNHCETNCERESGVCKCLPHVIGHKCDGCAPGFWVCEWMNIIRIYFSEFLRSNLRDS